MVGIEPHDHSLTKTVRYHCATWASQKREKSVGSGGFEPPKLSQLIYSQSHFDHFGNCP